jgi:hypothetical protein
MSIQCMFLLGVMQVDQSIASHSAKLDPYPESESESESSESGVSSCFGTENSVNLLKTTVSLKGINLAFRKADLIVLGLNVCFRISANLIKKSTFV